MAEGAGAPSVDARPGVVIVGAGQTGRALARHLASDWRVTVLDTDPEKLSRLHEDLGEAVQSRCADGASRLALTGAAGSGAEWVVATTDRDEVNIEVCRVAAELAPAPARIGTLRDSRRIPKMRATGAEGVSRPSMVASQIRNRIERSHQVATSLGLGQGEIREIQVLPTSPAVNVRLKDLGARNWIIAGIYRAGRFVVPHGDAVIEVGDRLLITGEPDVAPGAAEFLREGKSLFPLQFGSHIVVYAERPLPEVAWREADYLFRTSRARRFRIVAPEEIGPPPDFGVPPDRLARAAPGSEPTAAVRPDAGCVILERGEASFAARIGWNTPGFLATMAQFSCPALLPGGTFPWERLVVPVTDLGPTLRAFDTAIGLAQQFGIPLAVLAVTPPHFIGGEVSDKGELGTALAAIERMAGLYRTRVPVVRSEGNPPRQVGRLTKPGDLVVIGYDRGRTGSFFRPDPAIHMMLRTSASILAVPTTAGH